MYFSKEEIVLEIGKIYFCHFVVLAFAFIADLFNACLLFMTGFKSYAYCLRPGSPEAESEMRIFAPLIFFFFFDRVTSDEIYKAARETE